MSALLATTPSTLVLPDVFADKIASYILEDKATRFEILPNFQLRFIYWINKIENTCDIYTQTLEKVQECAKFLIQYTSAKLLRPYNSYEENTDYYESSCQGTYTFKFSTTEKLMSFALHCRVLKILENCGFTLQDSNSDSASELEIKYTCKTAAKEDLEKKFAEVKTNIRRIYYENVK